MVDLDMIHQVADPEYVCEALGVETQQRGSRKSILCPVHPDTHYGSCFLTENGFHCFSCGAGGDVITLVEKVKGCSFREACIFLGNLYGICTPDGKENQEKPPYRMLSVEEQKLIFLYHSKNSVSTTVRFAPDRMRRAGEEAIPIGKGPEFDMPEHILDAPIYRGPEKEGYAIVKKVLSSPLYNLLKNEPEIYRRLIADKAGEASEVYRKIIETLTHKEDILTAPLYQAGHKIGEKIGIGFLLKMLRDTVRKCDDIRIEFGGKKEVCEDELSDDLTLFGPISRNGVSI